MAIVVDASAFVEFLKSPKGSPLRGAFAEGSALSPELLDVEVFSAITRLERSREITTSAAERSLRALRTAPIKRVPHAGLIADAWKRRENVSAYDAVYVSLAAKMEWPLVTADRSLASAPGLGVPVTLLPA